LRWIQISQNKRTLQCSKLLTSAVRTLSTYLIRSQFRLPVWHKFNNYNYSVELGFIKLNWNCVVQIFVQHNSFMILSFLTNHVDLPTSIQFKNWWSRDYQFQELFNISINWNKIILVQPILGTKIIPLSNYLFFNSIQ
jgi:hypothetical protein